MTSPKARENKQARPEKGGRGRQDHATRMAKALAHPLRAWVLTRLNERVASPNELADESGDSLGNVSYHVRTLLDLECIELVDTKPRRGAVEHYYRATQRPWGDDRVWELLPQSARRAFAGHWFEEAFNDASSAIEAGGFDERADCHLTHTRLHLDERAWRKLAKRMDGLLEYALRLQAESAGRAKDRESDVETHTGLILAQYERAPVRRR